MSIPVPSPLRRRAVALCSLAALGWGGCDGGGVPEADRATALDRAAIESPSTTPATQAAPSPGLMHIVHFWLTDGLTEEERADFLAGVRSLGEVPTVRGLWVGPPAATPSRGVVDNSFDYALVVWFDDIAGHDAYQEHPIHLAFVEGHEAKFARVRVRDHAPLE